MNLSQKLSQIDGVRETSEAVAQAAALLTDIHLLLDGKEWSSETTSRIAELMQAAGYEIRSSGECPDLDPLPKYGDHMTVDEFRDAVACGAFIPDDGDGCWATDAAYDNGSCVWDGLKNPPKWATHVVWFNK